MGYLQTHVHLYIGSYKKRNYTRKDCKPWFDFECKRKRKLFHQAKKTYDINVNGENRSNLCSVSKLYKKELHRAHRDYLTKTEKELREYLMSDPKKLWKILKDFDKKNSDNIYRKYQFRCITRLFSKFK